MLVVERMKTAKVTYLLSLNTIPLSAGKEAAVAAGQLRCNKATATSQGSTTATLAPTTATQATTTLTLPATKTTLSPTTSTIPATSFCCEDGQTIIPVEKVTLSVLVYGDIVWGIQLSPGL